MKLKKYTNSGFTLVEMIFALVVTSFSAILLSSIIYTYLSFNKDLYDAYDETSIKQIQLLFALSKNIKIENDMLNITYQNEDMYFEFDGDELVLKPGYQVFLNDLTDILFYQENKCIYMKFTHENNKQTNRIIGCK